MHVPEDGLATSGPAFEFVAPHVAQTGLTALEKGTLLIFQKQNAHTGNDNNVNREEQ
jgi:hypothetical protein